jgi:Reverse transcriptase (RNA-dependent DNA polymerase)
MKYKEAHDEYKLFFPTGARLWAIKELDTQKAPGEDGIHAEFLQNSGPPLFRQQLLSVINRSRICQKSQAMESWQDHSSDPEKGQRCKSDRQLYRPIALTSVLAKTAERMVANRLTTFVEEKELSSAHFKPPTERTGRIHRSTKAKEGFAKGETTMVVSIDLTAAFDVIDRGHVIREMKVPLNITKWLADITERRIKVDCKVRHTISGVAQGTVLIITTERLN